MRGHYIKTYKLENLLCWKSVKIHIQYRRIQIQKNRLLGKLKNDVILIYQSKVPLKLLSTFLGDVAYIFHLYLQTWHKWKEDYGIF